MHYLIGTDEAGYGPNLGPLVITATVWQVPESISHADLYRAVHSCITDRPRHFNKPKAKTAKPKAAKTKSAKTTKKKKTSKRRTRIDERIWIADSKKLYKPSAGKKGLASLERGVLAAIDASGAGMPVDWHDLWHTLCDVDHDSMKSLPWYADFDECLPIDITSEEATIAGKALREGLEDLGIRICRIRSRTIDAGQFNDLLTQFANKSDVLSNVTLELVAKQMDWLKTIGEGDVPVCVLCDKHGGRNHYAALISRQFPDAFVEVREESRQSSSYRLSQQPTEFCFQAKADNILAAGLASMVSKYLRELAMRAFNAFWQSHDGQLRPTAGYPLDAKRFKQEIAMVQSSLGIADEKLWRAR